MSEEKARQEQERRKQAEDTAQYILDLQRQLADAQGDSGRAAQIAADLYQRRETQRVRDMKLSAQQEAQALALVNQVAANMAKLPDNGKDIADFMLQLRRQAAEASGDKAQVAKLDEAILRRQMAERIDTLGLKGDQLAQAQQLIEQIVAGMGQVQEKTTIGAAGTFNAMEAQGLGAGGVADRIATATEATAKNTKKLADIASGDMSQSYIAGLYQLTGKANSAAWSINVDGVVMNFAAGECLFLGASGSKRGADDWEISFRFAASPNATNLTVGDILGINKKGWEYLWVRYADSEDEAAKVLVKKPVAAYVEKVYEEGNFGGLGMGS